MGKKKNSNYVTAKTSQAKLEKEKQAKKKKIIKVLVPVLIAVAIAVALALIIWGIVAIVDYVNENSSEPDLTVTHHATLVIKGYEDKPIHIELYGNEAPKTVENFVKLANEGFYDGLTFHRIIDGFMAQGGAFDQDDKEKDASSIVGEFESNGIRNRIKHEPGVIGMARSGDPNSASSGFYIVHEDASWLDGDYAAFGKVTSGMDVINSICTGRNSDMLPVKDRPVIVSISIHAAHD